MRLSTVSAPPLLSAPVLSALFSPMLVSLILEYEYSIAPTEGIEWVYDEADFQGTNRGLEGGIVPHGNFRF